MFAGTDAPCVNHVAYEDAAVAHLACMCCFDDHLHACSAAEVDAAREAREGKKAVYYVVCALIILVVICLVGYSLM